MKNCSYLWYILTSFNGYAKCSRYLVVRLKSNGELSRIFTIFRITWYRDWIYFISYSIFLFFFLIFYLSYNIFQVEEENFILFFLFLFLLFPQNLTFFFFLLFFFYLPFPFLYSLDRTFDMPYNCYVLPIPFYDIPTLRLTQLIQTSC